MGCFHSQESRPTLRAGTPISKQREKAIRHTFLILNLDTKMCICSGNMHTYCHAFHVHSGWYVPEQLLLCKRLLFVVGVEASTQVPVSRPAFPVACQGVCVASSELSCEPV